MNVHQKHGKLAVQLYENSLTGRKDDYSGKVMLRGSVTIADLADQYVADGCPLSREQITDVWNKLADYALDYLSDGFSVRLGVCTATPSVNGTFIGSAATFNPAVHTLTASFTPSEKTRKTLKNAAVEVAGLARTGTVINRVLDVKSGEENSRLTVGRNLKIYGARLTVQGGEEAVGVWFVSAADETKRVRVDPSDIVDNHPAQLTIVIPPLESGEWFIEIITQGTLNKDVLLKEARSCRFELPLFVE